MAVGMAVYIVFPLLSAETAGGPLPMDVTVLGDLKRRRLVVYDNLKDLEFEFQSGKIARDDYDALRTNYLGRGGGFDGGDPGGRIAEAGRCGGGTRNRRAPSAAQDAASDRIHVFCLWV